MISINEIKAGRLYGIEGRLIPVLTTPCIVDLYKVSGNREPIIFYVFNITNTSIVLSYNELKSDLKITSKFNEKESDILKIKTFLSEYFGVSIRYEYTNSEFLTFTEIIGKDSSMESSINDVIFEIINKHV